MKKLTFFLALLLSACLGKSPDSIFYMMNSPDFAAISQRRLNIVVAKVKVPDLLNRSQMVVYEPQNQQIKILEFNRWGEAYPDVVQSAVVNDLIALLPRAFVKRTYFDSSQADYNINIEINQVKAQQGEKVVLSAWWNIASAKGKILSQRQGVYEAKTKGDTIQDLVVAQSEAVLQMSKAIAQALIKL